MKLCSKCGENETETKHSYCRNCKLKYHETHPRKPYSLLTPEQKKKASAAAYLKSYVKRGVLEKLPCEFCGDSNSEGHHEDYNFPLFVIWLCRKHHMEVQHGRIEVDEFKPVHERALKRFYRLVKEKLYKPGKRIPSSIAHLKNIDKVIASV
jgi:hypothetical protein